MILLLLAAAAGLLAGRVCGGRLRYLAQLRVRTWSLVVAALAGQTFVGLLPGDLRPVVIVAVCTCLVVWCMSNLSLEPVAPGMLLLGTGVLANLVVIAANGGMPVLAPALGQAGIPRSLDVSRGLLYKHVAMATHHNLSFLGDRFPVDWFHTVVSAGDLVMLAGIFLVLWGASRPTRPTRVSLRAGRKVAATT